MIIKSQFPFKLSKVKALNDQLDLLKLQEKEVSITKVFVDIKNSLSISLFIFCSHANLSAKIGPEGR